MTSVSSPVATTATGSWRWLRVNLHGRRTRARPLLRRSPCHPQALTLGRQARSRRLSAPTSGQREPRSRLASVPPPPVLGGVLSRAAGRVGGDRGWGPETAG